MHWPTDAAVFGAKHLIGAINSFYSSLLALLDIYDACLDVCDIQEILIYVLGMADMYSTTVCVCVWGA